MLILVLNFNLSTFLEDNMINIFMNLSGFFGLANHVHTYTQMDDAHNDAHNVYLFKMLQFMMDASKAFWCGQGCSHESLS